jgi:RNA polymerase sigma factor for flagellar operon FliA
LAEHTLDTSSSTEIVPELPVYEGVAITDVVLVTSADAAAEAFRVLLAQEVIGFDTESKPTFNKGEISTGPHLIQLATELRVYLFQVDRLFDPEGMKAILESRQVMKVGFGLDSDLAQLRARLDIEAQNVLDLSRALRSEVRHQSLGAKTAVERYFGKRLQKSKRTTTSNWANPRLTERQMLYAANDAQVALRVYRAALLSVPGPLGIPREAGDAESRRLIATHTPMVMQIAQGLAKGLPASVETDDLIQDGLLGLMDAIIRSSRETTGRQFEKYIAQRVRGAMLDGLRANDGGTRRVRREMRRVEVAIQKLGHQLGRTPREGEVADALDIPIIEYQQLLQEAHGYLLISLDDLGGGEQAGDYLEECASSQQDPLVVLQRAAFRTALGGALEALPRQEKTVMAHYYEGSITMREIGDLLGISEGRVSQIHSQAIARLRGAVIGDEKERSVLAPRRQAR